VDCDRRRCGKLSIGAAHQRQPELDRRAAQRPRGQRPAASAPHPERRPDRPSRGVPDRPGLRREDLLAPGSGGRDPRQPRVHAGPDDRLHGCLRIHRLCPRGCPARARPLSLGADLDRTRSDPAVRLLEAPAQPIRAPVHVPERTARLGLRRGRVLVLQAGRRTREHRDRVSDRRDRPRARTQPDARGDLRRAEPRTALLRRQRRAQRPAGRAPGGVWDRPHAAWQAGQWRGRRRGGGRDQGDRRARAAVRPDRRQAAWALAPWRAARGHRDRGADVAAVRIPLLRSAAPHRHGPAVRHCFQRAQPSGGGVGDTHHHTPAHPLHRRRGDRRAPDDRAGVARWRRDHRRGLGVPGPDRIDRLVRAVVSRVGAAARRPWAQPAAAVRGRARDRLRDGCAPARVWGRTVALSGSDGAGGEHDRAGRVECRAAQAPAVGDGPTCRVAGGRA